MAEITYGKEVGSFNVRESLSSLEELELNCPYGDYYKVGYSRGFIQHCPGGLLLYKAIYDGDRYLPIYDVRFVTYYEWDTAKKNPSLKYLWALFSRLFREDQPVGKRLAEYIELDKDIVKNLTTLVINQPRR